MNSLETVWPNTNIGSVCQQIRGVSYSKDDVRDKPTHGYVPILRANNIIDDGVLTFDDLVYVPPRVVAESQYIKKHDIVLAASSGSLSVVGKAAQAKQDWHGGFGAFCKVLRPNKKVEPRYLAQYFRTTDYRQRISQLAAGANINNLRNEHIDDLEIPLPPMSEQKRIADILDKADTIRRKLRDAVTEFAQYPTAVFFEMFGDPRINVRSFPSKPLKSLVASNDTINYGVVQPGNDYQGGVPIVRVGDLKSLRVFRDDLKTIDPAIESQYSRSRLMGDEVLVACVGSIGLVALADEGLKGFNIARAVARIRCGSQLNRYFLAACLATPATQSYFRQETRTVSQPTLNISHIEETPILLPPIDQQDRFGQIVLRHLRALETLEATASEAAVLFEALVQRAFRGDL